MRIHLFICFICSLQLGHGQSAMEIDLYEKKSGEPILNAQMSLFHLSEVVFSSSNYSGELISLGELRPSSIRVVAKAEFYKKLDTIIYFSSDTWQKSKKQSIQISLGMHFDGQITEEYTIGGKYRPEVVFGSEVFSIADFEIDYAGNLFAIIYPKTLKKAAYIVKIEDGEIVKRYRIPFLPEGMTRDYSGKIYVLGKDSFWQLTYANGDIQIASSDRDWFDKQIAPIVDTFEQHIYYTTYVSHYPAFECMRVSSVDSVYKELYYIEDSEMMEHYRAEYKYADIRTKLWAWDMERATNVDREVWVGANSYTQSIYWEPPYAPVYLDGDTILIFDHYKDHLYKMDVREEIIQDSVKISYHKPWRSNWSKRVIQDPKTKSIYVLFDKAGYYTLKHINTYTGKLEEELSLHYRYVEKIRIIDGWVHYIYRPFESTQKKYLYKERIVK
jgi:hypothetical protein